MSISSNKVFLRFLFLFILIDLFFIPRLSYPAFLPVSLFICLSFFLFSTFSKKSLLIFFIISTALFLSILNAVYLDKSSAIIYDDLKRAIQFLSFFLYGAFAYRYEPSKKDEFFVLYILRFSFVVFFILGVLFVVSPALILNTIGFLYPESTFIHEENIRNLRFSYIFTDPNSAGYFYVMCLFVYLNLEFNSFLKVVYIFISSCLIVLSQSRGAMLSLSLLLLWVYFFDRKLISNKFVIYSLLALPFGALLFYKLGGGEILFLLQERSQYEDSLGGGRIGKYIYFLNNFNFLPFGEGYNLIIDGVAFKPHSDLIRINLSYGLVVLFLFFYLVWPKVKSHIGLMIPFMISFLLNSMIDEYRLFGLFLFFQGFLYNLHKNKTFKLN